MKFLDDDFLLTTDTARQLFHEVAKVLPIIDFHNHLSPREIAEDITYENLAQTWLATDHYKWRAMRINGACEDLCSGKQVWEKKFNAWVDTLQNAIGNPLHLWSHLELRRYFGIATLLTPKTADSIYQKASSLLCTKEFSARNLLRKMNVSIVCTTDDPTDDLRWHKHILDSLFEIKVVPTFRPDKAFNIRSTQSYLQWIDLLSAAAGVPINSLDSLLGALCMRMDYFETLGCKCSDHSLESFDFCRASPQSAADAFKKVLDGKNLDRTETISLQTILLLELGREYARRGWVWQLHVGALRNVRQRIFNTFGADSGADCIDDTSIIRPLALLMDELDKNNSLPKTVLYNLNPKDNTALMALVGGFADGSSPGKIQWGPAWWFSDQRNGIIQHLDTLSNGGLLGRFIGMTTDSRSLLSFPRHELFRRSVCSWLSDAVVRGEIPDEDEILKALVENVCFANAHSYFGFDKVS